MTKWTEQGAYLDGHRRAAGTGAALEGPAEMLDGPTRYLSK
jgi:hypothetical protein